MLDNLVLSYQRLAGVFVRALFKIIQPHAELRLKMAALLLVTRFEELSSPLHCLLQDITPTLLCCYISVAMVMQDYVYSSYDL